MVALGQFADVADRDAGEMSDALDADAGRAQRGDVLADGAPVRRLKLARARQGGGCRSEHPWALILDSSGHRCQQSAGFGAL